MVEEKEMVCFKAFLSGDWSCCSCSAAVFLHLSHFVSISHPPRMFLLPLTPPICRCFFILFFCPTSFHSSQYTSSPQSAIQNSVVTIPSFLHRPLSSSPCIKPQINRNSPRPTQPSALNPLPSPDTCAVTRCSKRLWTGPWRISTPSGGTRRCASTVTQQKCRCESPVRQLRLTWPFCGQIAGNRDYGSHGR